MKPTTLQALTIIPFLAASTAGLFAQNNSFSEGVICRTNRTLVQHGSELSLLPAPTTMAGGIKVSTNGTFQVYEGKARSLEPGQVLRGDGIMLNPDGSVMTVFDHIAMSNGKVMVFKDGAGEALSGPLTFPDGSVINPDGFYARPTGRRSRLVDGQMVTPEGASMAGLDSITLRNGKAIIYKSGALISLQSPVQIMGMADGSRIRADGLITRRDGSTTQLAEGETITVESLRASW